CREREGCSVRNGGKRPPYFSFFAIVLVTSSSSSMMLSSMSSPAARMAARGSRRNQLLFLRDFTIHCCSSRSTLSSWSSKGSGRGGNVLRLGKPKYLSVQDFYPWYPGEEEKWHRQGYPLDHQGDGLTPPAGCTFG